MVGSCVCLAAVLALSVSAVPATEGSRDLGYEPYDSLRHPEKWQLSTLGECGGLLKPLLTGLLIVALLKLPLLLGKMLLLKAAVPLAVGAALLPLGLYAAYRGAPMPDQSKPESRSIHPDCLHAAACSLGSVAPKAAVSSATWVMKNLEEGVEATSRLEISSYREAYTKGASSMSCSAYDCHFF